MSVVTAGSDSSSEAGRLAIVGLLVVQMLLGYEWLVSGLTKVVRGGFPSGLADELREKSAEAPGWYRSFLDDAIIDHARTFGYLIELGELVVGSTLIVAAAIWLVRWERLSKGAREALLIATALAALGGTFMAINFHLANGAAHPWLIPESGFDEGVDLDSLLPALQLVLFAVSIALLRTLRRDPDAPRPPHIFQRRRT